MSEEKYEIVKFVDEELELEVNVSPKEETIWMTLDQIALLFDRDKSVISRHIKKIYLNEEMDYLSTVAKNATVQIEGNRKITREIIYYNLDIIICIGYRVNSKKGSLFRKWANKVLKEYLLKGYVVNENRTNVTEENFNNLVVVVNNIYSSQITTNERLLKLEDKVFDKEYLLNKIFYEGQFYDSYTLIQQIFESATDEIIIIDNYIDRTVLDRLVVKKKNVKVTIYTIIQTRLLGNDIDIFNKQYGNLEVKYTTKVNDRYIIIDKEKIYHLGYSIKDLGKKICSISESDINLIKELLSNI